MVDPSEVMDVDTWSLRKIIARTQVGGREQAGVFVVLFDQQGCVCVGQSSGGLDAGGP